MDADSEQGDLFLRVRGTKHYMCVDLIEGAVDFVDEADMEPTKFVLSIPKKHIAEKKCSLVKMQTTQRSLYRGDSSK